jgi:hypothetical protein
MTLVVGSKRVKSPNAPGDQLEKGTLERPALEEKRHQKAGSNEEWT